MLEVERYRQPGGHHARARPIVGVDAPDPWFLKRGLDASTVDGALVGRSFDAARRIGKLLLLDVADGPDAWASDSG